MTTQDDLGQEIPGPIWHTAMRYTGLAAARRIIWLKKVWRRTKQRMRECEKQAATLQRRLDDAYQAWEGNWRHIARQCDWLKARLEGARKEADQLRADRDRAERLLQEQATEIRKLREQVRQAAEQTK